MVDLDHKFPILFFPIRIETRYRHSNDETKRTLRLRFFPDQVTIDNFDPRLTLKEFNDAKRYWTGKNRNTAWIKLANRYGLQRAAYISKAVINYDPVSDPDPTNPSFKADNAVEFREESDIAAPLCRLLPSHFIFHGKFKDPTLGTIEKIGNVIPESLSFDHFLLDTATESPSPNWVTDFDKAIDKGMAMEVNLTKEQYSSGFEYIIVYGVRDDLSPDQTKQQVENLLRAQRYSVGLSFVKQGTPTNLTREKSKDVQSFFSSHSLTQSDILKYRLVEFAPLPESSSIGSLDGRIFENALGLDNTANGLLNADNDDQDTARAMLFALWPSLLGYFMKTFVNMPNIDRMFLLLWYFMFNRGVSAQGPIPPIRIGKTPYGILPVTISSSWEDKTVQLVGKNELRDSIGHLKARWTKFINEVPTVTKSGEGLDPIETLLDILSMEAISPNYYVRGIRSVSYISDFIFEILGVKTPSGMPAVSDSELKAKNMISLNILLKIIFPKIPNLALDKFYELCPGEGISEIQFPLVNSPDDADSLNPNYIDNIIKDIQGPNKNFLKMSTKEQEDIPGVGPSNSDPLLFRLLRYSAGIMGKKPLSSFQTFYLTGLIHLNTKRPDTLKTFMLQTLDLVSYRLDAWISSFANLRLRTLRVNTAKGLHTGAFGWVENLVPKIPQNGTQPEEQVPEVPEGGYIQTPSYAHAAAAAVLRNAYLTHFNDKGKKDLLKINLNSERTKMALEIVNSIQYTPLSELLGYRLERRLHDAEIDYLIDEFRKHFPLNKDDRKELADAQQSGQERIEPRNVTDGLSVFKHWKRLTKETGYSDVKQINETMKNDPGWNSFYSEIRTKYGPEDQKMLELINALKPQLNFLLDQMDGLSDLCIAESVYQAVSGNYLRAGAVLDGMSGDGQIPVPEISTIPRSGLRQVQRVALALEVKPIGNLNLLDVNDNLSWTSPRKLAEPNLNDLIGTYIGATLFWFDVKDTSGNVTSTEKIGLEELGLEPIDLIYIENSELESRLNYYAKRKGFTNYDIRLEAKRSSDEIETISFSDIQFLIKNLRSLMSQGHSLRYSDFISPNKSIEGEMLVESIKVLFQRYYDIVLLLLHTIGQLELSRNDVTEAGIENKKQAIIKAGFFVSEFSVPLNAEANIMVEEELNNKIDIAKEVLMSRLSSPEDQVKKLSEWRSKLQADGEKKFLESITDEIAGDPEDEKKYHKTIDFLVELIKKILNNNSFLILPPFNIPTTDLSKLKSSPRMNRDILKWIGKASYVRPQLKYLDEIITHNQILDSAYFTFHSIHLDKEKFMKSAAEILATGNEDANLTSIILAMSTKTGEQEKSFPSKPSDTNAVLIGVVADEWTDKIVSKDQETFIAYNYDAPSTEAPQSLLLAVSPNDLHRWNDDTIRQVILETLELVKIRAVSYKSLKGLQNFLPTLIFNSFGEDVNIDLLGGSSN